MSSTWKRIELLTKLDGLQFLQPIKRILLPQDVIHMALRAERIGNSGQNDCHREKPEKQE
jgi:hypothetical protein